MAFFRFLCVRNVLIQLMMHETYVARHYTNGPARLV